MSEPNTHLLINPELVGSPEKLEPGYALVELTTSERMVADSQGLVHGGFIFGLADYAAMLAVNDPNVVLGAAETRFLQPVALGDSVQAEAKVTAEKGKKRSVEVSVRRAEVVVFEGTFTCFVLPQHVLSKA